MRENELFLYKIPANNYSSENIAADDLSIDKAIGQIFLKSNLDSENFGNPEWNPLNGLILPGQNVLIKPNMVLEKSHQTGEDYRSVVTHPQIIRSIVKYVFIALNGIGKITIGDAPINSANFNQLCVNMGLFDLQEEYRQKGFTIELVDFRLYKMNKDDKGIISQVNSSVDKSDYVEIKMDEKSALKEIDAKYKRFRVTEYNPAVMPSKHNESEHRYCFHRVALEADIIISLPKIKTHRKAGLTCAMKNFVGLNGNKDYLPHHTKFSTKEGGDEYLNPSLRKHVISFLWDVRWSSESRMLQRIFLGLEKLIWMTWRIKQFKDKYVEGSWWGNKTISRTVCDLNRAILYSDKNGVLQPIPQRKLLYLVDGIICGEGEGPMQAVSKICNFLILGSNSYAVDLLVARLIGFEAKKMHTFALVPLIEEYPISQFNSEGINIFSNLFEEGVKLKNIRDYLSFNFLPTSGWNGHIELD
jgi:uncharacterized protein (DUF362 family)